MQVKSGKERDFKAGERVKQYKSYTIEDGVFLKTL